jgi:hypothetical protein
MGLKKISDIFLLLTKQMYRYMFVFVIRWQALFIVYVYGTNGTENVVLLDV